MQCSNKKIGFWSLTALVTGNLVGSGVFLLPSTLAPFGTASIIGWIVATFGAILLALVFGQLSSKHPRSGDPHVYVEDAFGKELGFFVAWGYWVLAWVSNTGLIVATVGYLSKVFGTLSTFETLLAEISIVVIFTLINLKGVCFSGVVELVITIIKIIPLFLIPLIGLFYIEPHNFLPINPTDQPLFTAVNGVVLLTIWGYIGLETGTVPSGDVANAKRVVPRAIVMGTSIAAVVYILGTISILGVVPRETLMHSGAPYADLSTIIFGGQWHQCVAILAVITCVGSLNGWILVVGQIAYGAAKDGLFPLAFGTTTKSGAPKWGLIISSLCSIPFLAMSLQENLIQQFNFIVDVCVTLIILIYILCMAAFMKFLWQGSHVKKRNWFLAAGAMAFSCVALYGASLRMALLSLSVFAFGLPVYIWQKRQKLI